MPRHVREPLQRPERPRLKPCIIRDRAVTSPPFTERVFGTNSTDPCGERGEFHTCVFAGPIFAEPLQLERGERVLRDGRFEYCDLLLRGEAASAMAGTGA